MTTSLPSDGSGYRILIENSEYWLRNNGDLAMLEVTVRRLRQRWPNARIGVMTESPALVRAFFPDVDGITVFDDDPWRAQGPIAGLAGRVGPAIAGPAAIGGLRGRGWLRAKAVAARDRLRAGISARKSEPVAAAPSDDVATSQLTDTIARHYGAARAAREATLVLGLGGGYLTDADVPQAGRALDLLEHAHEAGVPVAMVGQGLGPMRDPELRARAAAVLPLLGLLGLRENRRGPALLESLAVPAANVVVTGDDAIELAYNLRTDTLGSDIGVCLRVAQYAPVAAAAQGTVGRVVRGLAAELGAGLVPLIIAETPGSPDRKTTLPLVRGAQNVTPALGRFVRPSDVANQVARCRLLVTGAYHLAVFALSQGIPVVGLTSTEYYDDKFLGLSQMFGGGVVLVHLDDDQLEETLSQAIRSTWAGAADVRADLRASAVEQIAAGRAAFDRVFALVERDDIEHV